MRRTYGVLVVAILVFAGWSVVRAQTRTPPPAESPDIMPALLEEVRGLRAALEHMTSAGPRVQLALGRLQLQEARLNTSVKRLDEVRARLTQLQREQAEQQQQLAAMELAMREASHGLSVGSSPGETIRPEQLEEIRAEVRRRLKQLNTDVERLTAEESIYATDVASEQARWTEFNQRLEDLERALRPLK